MRLEVFTIYTYRLRKNMLDSLRVIQEKIQIDGNFIDMIDYKQLNYNNYRSSHNVACHTEHTGLGVKPPIVYI